MTLSDPLSGHPGTGNRWMRLGLWFGGMSLKAGQCMLADVGQLDLRNKTFCFVATTDFPAEVLSLWMISSHQHSVTEGRVGKRHACRSGWLQHPTEAGRFGCSAVFLERNRAIPQLQPSSSSAQGLAHRSCPLAGNNSDG